MTCTRSYAWHEGHPNRHVPDEWETSTHDSAMLAQKCLNLLFVTRLFMSLLTLAPNSKDWLQARVPLVICFMISLVLIEWFDEGWHGRRNTQRLAQ